MKRFPVIASVAVLAAGSHASEPPPVPLGADAIRRWEEWPLLRTGVRTYMRSTYDRRGNNEGADASHFLYQLADDRNVTLDIEAPGILCFARYNHWHGSPWQYEVDGTLHIVQESSSADPDHPVAGSVFLPEAAFPNPLTWTWSVTKGADLMWVPIGFERSFRMAYTRTHYGTGYYIWQQWVPGLPLTTPVRTWTASPPDPDILALLQKSGTRLIPEPLSGEGRRLGLTEHSGLVNAAANRPVMLTSLTGAGVVRALEFRIPEAQAVAFGRSTLRITWDDRAEPSIESPVALFFGAGTLYNRDGREYLVRAFPVWIRQAGGYVHLACFLPMPFFSSARIELESAEEDIRDVAWSATVAPFTGRPEHYGYLHATFRDHPDPVPGEDLVLLDTRGLEGSADWSGSFIGTSFIFTHDNVLTTLEGDPRFFFDDSESPQAYGTGTEEWGGGGDYWGGRNMTLPFAGHPVGARSAAEAKNREDRIHSAYRFLLSDLFPFGKNARIHLEHGGVNESTEHYRTLTYWYGRPGATIRRTDVLEVGDESSERDHHWESPDASAPVGVESRYELGPDRIELPPPAHNGPVAAPDHFLTFTFEAEAGTWAVWLRGTALIDDLLSDSCWLEFDDDIGTGKPGAYSHPKGFGNWRDDTPAGTWSWSGALPSEPARTVTFERSGTHRLRIQPRHAPHALSAIWLSRRQLARPSTDAMPEPGPDDILLRPQDAVARQGAWEDDPDGGEAGAVAIRASLSSRIIEANHPHRDTGRVTTGTSEFTLKLDPANRGVLLRRKLDYQYPNQRAEVSIAVPDADGAVTWVPAGVWYLAGSNTCVYSNPREETGATLHETQTSNRRFRQDEFLVPLHLTRNRDSIRIRLRFTPVDTPLFPGHPLPERAWSAFRYEAWCFTNPQ